MRISARIVHIQYLVALYEALGCWWMASYWKQILEEEIAHGCDR